MTIVVQGFYFASFGLCFLYVLRAVMLFLIDSGFRSQRYVQKLLLKA